MPHLVLPIYWTNEKKTKKSSTHLMSMNWYATCHFLVQNKAKQDFHELILNQSDTIPTFDQFSVHYDLYYKNINSDPSNIIAIIEKYTLDGLALAGKIPNDNFKHHLSSSWTAVSQDKLNPRCEVTITEIPPKEPNESTKDDS